MYTIIVCYKCGKLLLAKTNQKTRTCPHCQTRLTLQKTKKIAQTKTPQQATTLIQTIKKKQKNLTKIHNTNEAPNFRTEINKKNTVS